MLINKTNAIIIVIQYSGVLSTKKQIRYAKDSSSLC